MGGCWALSLPLLPAAGPALPPSALPQPCEAAPEAPAVATAAPARATGAAPAAPAGSSAPEPASFVDLLLTAAALADFTCAVGPAGSSLLSAAAAAGPMHRVAARAAGAASCAACCTPPRPKPSGAVLMLTWSSRWRSNQKAIALRRPGATTCMRARARYCSLCLPYRAALQGIVLAVQPWSCTAG
jgi:hypothetical protein